MCAVQYPAAVLVADVDRAGNVGRVMEHRMMTLAQLIVILQFSDAAREGRRDEGRKSNVCGALPGEVQSSGILPFQSASLRFPAVWPNASLRTGSKTVRRRSRYRNTWRASKARSRSGECQDQAAPPRFTWKSGMSCCWRLGRVEGPSLARRVCGLSH
jgi:hypothetical protein